MAVTARFLADFSSFHDAVQKADVELRGMETGAGRVGAALNRMVDGFSGRKLIQDATLSAEAVERIGGTSKLTASELGRVQAQAVEAAAKLRAMGQDVPPGIQKIADSVKATGGSLDSMKSVVGSLAGAFGVAFSVGAVVNFGKHVFDTASNVHDLASKLGISTDAVQGFKYAAEQSGSSMDAVGTAINKMNANLAGGEKGTVQALKDAGLQFSAIRNLKPEDAFLAITDAIQKIPDPMTQADVAMALFGKSASDLLPAIKEGFRGLSDSATKMSEDTINSLEAAEDAWGRLADKVTIMSGTIIASTLNAASQVTSSWAGFAQFAENAIHFGIGAAVAMADAQEQAAKAAGKNRDVHLPLAGAVRKTADEMAAAAAAAKRHAEALENLFQKFSGGAAASSLRDLDIVFRRMADSGKITEQQVRAIAKEAANLSKEGAVLSPRLWAIVLATDQLAPKVELGAEAFAKLGTKIELAVPQADRLKGLLPQVESGVNSLIGTLPKLDLGYQFERAKGKIADSSKALGDLSTAFSQLAQIAGGAIGTIVQTMGTLVGALNTATKGVDAFKEGKKAFSDGASVTGILGMASGLLGIASAAIAAGKAIANLFDRNKGRDLVVDFAETFGGFDTLHAQLLTLGDAGEALWIKLTQGVGRNNPAQAQSVIDEVTAALAKQESQAGNTSSATEEQAVATIETASQAQAALDQLGVRLDDNVIEWRQWGADVRSVIDDIANGIRSLPLPSVGGSSALPDFGHVPSGVPGFAAGTGGKYVNFGAGTLAMLHGRERVMTEAEGRSGAGPTQITLVTQRGDVMWEWLMNEAGAYGTTR